MPLKRTVLQTMRNFIIGFFMTLLATPAVAEPNIQALATPQGMGVWLVESPALPMVAVEVAFRAGSSFDTPERTGLANLTASLFDEGAGNYDATAFNEELEKIGARLYVSADRTDSSLMLYALPEHLPRSLELLGLALTKPRFDEDAVERVFASRLLCSAQECRR
jgi:zinc protease